MATTYSICDGAGSVVMGGYESEVEAVKAGQAWANGNGEPCTLVSDLDDTDALYEFTPVMTDD